MTNANIFVLKDVPVDRNLGCAKSVRSLSTSIILPKIRHSKVFDLFCDSHELFCWAIFHGYHFDINISKQQIDIVKREINVCLSLQFNRKIWLAKLFAQHAKRKTNRFKNQCANISALLGNRLHLCENDGAHGSRWQ